MDPVYHLAQVNVALLREPIDSELPHDFVSELDAVNAQAEQAPGFVWRLQTEAFTFKQRFSAPRSESIIDDNDHWLCPA